VTSGAVRRWIVRGAVQGVGFRWFVRQRAATLGLAGFAQNLADGSVEVVARGDEAALAQLEDHLRAGPRFSRVSSVDRVDVPHDMELPRSFETW
jgi:acylphosphatase